jgi:hypothetical protein
VTLPCRQGRLLRRAERALCRSEPDLASTDGDIGRVQGLVIDCGSRHVTHVLLQEGHRWGRKDVAIPIGAVASTSDGIQLTITKYQVEDHPQGARRPPGPACTLSTIED